MKKVKYNELVKDLDVELEVKEVIIDTIVKFLAHCVVKGLLKKNSPQIAYLLREAMEFARIEK